MKKDNSKTDMFSEELMKLFITKLKENIEINNSEAIENKEIPDFIEFNRNRLVRFTEISEEGKEHIIYINTSSIKSVIEYEGTVIIRIDTPEFAVYRVKESLKEVLNRIE